MPMLVDTLSSFAKELGSKKRVPLPLLFKYNQLIAKEVIERLEEGKLSVYLGFEVEKAGKN